MYNTDAPVTFFVSSFTPVEFGESDKKLTVGGFDLDRVLDAFIRNPDGEDQNVIIISKSSENIQLDLSEADVPENTMFFVILRGENESWTPVGPLMLLNLRSQS